MQALSRVLFSKSNTLLFRQINNSSVFTFAGKGKEGGKAPADKKPAGEKKEKVLN